MNYGFLLILTIAPVIVAHAESGIPAWIKNSAGWWADGTIDDSTFLSSIEFLIGEGIVDVPPTEAEAAASGAIPAWVKNNAGWWADGTIDDETFVSALQFLIRAGVIVVEQQTEKMDATPITASVPAAAPEPASGKMDLEAALEECNAIKSGREKIACRNEVKEEAAREWYRDNSTAYVVGPITYYYPGVGADGNAFYYQGYQPILDVTMLVINTGSDSSVGLSCTSPSICNYDVWDGSRSFKYTSTNFVSGQHVINPGDSREINILFGPNIGYGGTEFEYDASKEYVLRIQESFGGVDVPLALE